MAAVLALYLCALCARCDNAMLLREMDHISRLLNKYLSWVNLSKSADLPTPVSPTKSTLNVWWKSSLASPMSEQKLDGVQGTGLASGWSQVNGDSTSDCDK